MREWPNRTVSKTVVLARAPWVRIPLPPLEDSQDNRLAAGRACHIETSRGRRLASTAGHSGPATSSTGKMIGLSR
jgi:hypothetical protein